MPTIESTPSALPHPPTPRRGRALLILLALAPAVGCEGNDNGTAFVPQSVPVDKPLVELDASEQASFCDEAIDWAKALLSETLPRLTCRTQAISAGATAAGFDVAACQAAERECLEDPDREDFDPDQVECNIVDVGVQCDATVGEFAACFEETASLTDQLLAELTCEGTAAGTAPQQEDYQVSAQCQALLDRCVPEGEAEPPPDSDDGPAD